MTTYRTQNHNYLLEINDHEMTATDSTIMTMSNAIA